MSSATDGADAVTNAPTKWLALLSGTLKTLTHAAWTELVLLATGKTNATTGFTLAGGTTSKTLTVDADATISSLTKDQISAAAAETTIADTDTFPKLVSGVLKQITWANMKAAMKTALGYAAQAVGFTLAGGTSSKTLTVDADATISSLTKDQISACLLYTSDAADE